ncbi:LysM peptidoglycan-binding domain-containing protein [Mucilaginibacter sp. HMF5004]|uniref:lytic transglycosylase domain-containing protein n=1 Tax=Mucilaginibacter rivuli TaxID=2857527 RepID=UPI001C602120|nr:lytic transglycosylase domain-containing protein [Mucilaginibacter rivuli]MBW4888691.1 LysM peptidoglycan-binding domain-containing protein [Mucilaginibacter rivuli]
MKKFWTFIICLTIIQQVKAHSEPLSLKKSKSDSSYNEKPGDTTLVPLVTVVSGFQDPLSKRRLDSIKKEIPLDYNEYVQTYIDLYTRRKDEMGRIIGLSKYYFPIYEKSFHDAGVPEEIKYLSVVESSLDPNAVSRVGATGPWQFMFATAKLYGLSMDNYIDERKDPIQASYAAAAYIKDAYLDFGDWLVAIASYNCGKGNITRAIQLAGASDFWSIRPYLPAETRNYVPAYIAMSYVMNYYGRHGIMPRSCDLSAKTDTIMVNKFVSLAGISTALKIDMSQLNMLNPQYKKHIINGSAAAPKRLVIPQIRKEDFAVLYNVLNDSAIAPNQLEPVYASTNETSSFTRPLKAEKEETLPTSHKVKRGETLASIADKYGMEPQELKAWNHLATFKVSPGLQLRLTAPTGTEERYSAAKEKAIPAPKSYLTYKVKTGDTLSQIAEKFDGATVEKIKSLNGLKAGRLQPGMTLKINRG